MSVAVLMRPTNTVKLVMKTALFMQRIDIEGKQLRPENISYEALKRIITKHTRSSVFGSASGPHATPSLPVKYVT